ncbi:MAG: methionine--tRNA ligase subunit beta, partial [Pseudobdellovibrionaceae bacterium]
GASMLNKNFNSKLTTMDPAGEKVFNLGIETGNQVKECFNKRDFSKGMTLIRDLADEANRYFDEKAPWKLIKENPNETQQVLTSTLNLFRQIAIMLSPILPSYSNKVQTLLNDQAYQWKDISTRLENKVIQNYEHLTTRVDPVIVDQMLAASVKKAAEAQALKDALKKKAQDTLKQSANKTDLNTKGPATAMDSNQPTPQENTLISIDDFSKIDLRIAKIIEAEEIKEADKLLRIKAELADGQVRQIIAGIKLAYKPEDLVGKHVLVVANLAPRKMKFGMSEGMILAGGAGGSELFFVQPDSSRLEMVQPGQKVK